MVKSRIPMQVDPNFEAKIKDLQRRIMMKKGEHPSLRDLTGKIVKDPNFALIEKRLLENLEIGIEINFDRRKR